ncbi:metallophosphoesterase [Microvirga yunnanensis]|uniref:metallophosphoesterase n=1 Tax=Microvirga yunnanensis TaxID=2953740 RepID=UPI0021C5F1A9|nr:metallophosphoesterase [Microvirga sp. HBU67655]
MAMFFTADSHFGHANLCGKLQNSRPFSSIDEHDEVLVAKWNETVGPDDEVWHLGDFSHRCHPKRMGEIFRRLNGRKRLVVGNHDNGATRALGWASVHEMLRFSPGGHQMFACHYPVRSWPGMNRGAIHLYGHVHGSLAGLGRSMDVGVDAHAWAPVSLDEVLARMLAIPKPGRQDEAA